MKTESYFGTSEMFLRNRKLNWLPDFSAANLKLASAPSSRGSVKLYFSTKQAILDTEGFTLLRNEQNLFGYCLQVLFGKLLFLYGLQSTQISFIYSFLYVKFANWDFESLIHLFCDCFCLWFCVGNLAEKAFNSKQFTLEWLSANSEFIIHAQAFHGAIKRAFVLGNFEAIVNEWVNREQNYWKT